MVFKKELKRYFPNENKSNKGDACKNFILVLDGCVRVQLSSEGGREVTLYRVRPGDTCALTTSCLVGKEDYPAEAIVEEDVTALMIPDSEFRQALLDDRLSDAERMLGKPYRICGRVAHGDKRGRTIGFPTANIRLNRPAIPLSGVYSVTMCSPELGDVQGIANIGKRPTVDGVRDQLEVHLFDFEKNIYGMNICVSFHHKIRDEKKFDSFELLKQQIALDCVRARELHETMNN